jgi:hypothetical protein
MPCANAEGPRKPLNFFPKCLPAEAITTAFDFAKIGMSAGSSWSRYIISPTAARAVVSHRSAVTKSKTRATVEYDTPLGVKTWVQTIPLGRVLKVIEQANPSGAKSCSMVPDSALIQAVIN